MALLQSIINAILKWLQPKPTPTPPTPIPLPTSEEELLFMLINNERKKVGLKELLKNDKITKAAVDYANLMATRNKLDHNINGNVGLRLNDVGYKWTYVGENIGWNYKNAQAMVSGWMSSPGHKANILNANYTESGVGIANKGNGPYYCQVFAKSS